jgi:hypothetical protein
MEANRQQMNEQFHYRISRQFIKFKFIITYAINLVKKFYLDFNYC